MPGGQQRPEGDFSTQYGQAQQQQQQSQSGHAPNGQEFFWTHGSAQQSHPFGSSDPFASMGFPPMRSMFSDPFSAHRRDPFDDPFFRHSSRHDPFDDPFFRQPVGGGLFGGGLFGGLFGSFFQGMSDFPQLQSSYHHHQQQQQQRQQEQQWQQQQQQQQEIPRQNPPPLSVQEVDPTSPDAAFGTTGECIVEHPDSDSEDSDVEELPRNQGRAGPAHYQEDSRPQHVPQQPYHHDEHQQPYRHQQQGYQQQQQQQSIVTTDHPFPGLGSLFGGGGYSSSFSSHSSYVSHSGIGGVQYYTESSSRRVGPGGVVEEQHSQRDSSGRESMRLSRGINEKGRTVTRSRQGQEETSSEILHNITPEEARTFDATWQRRARGDFSDAPSGQGQSYGQLPYGPASSSRRTPGA